MPNRFKYNHSDQFIDRYAPFQWYGQHHRSIFIFPFLFLMYYSADLLCQFEKKKNTKQKLGILWALEIINTLKIHESNALVLQLQRIWFALQKFHINRTLICHRERN